MRRPGLHSQLWTTTGRCESAIKRKRSLQVRTAAVLRIAVRSANRVLVRKGGRGEKHIISVVILVRTLSMYINVFNTVMYIGFLPKEVQI